jgi:membrane protein
VHWRAVLPSAVATSLFWIGMDIVFALTFSNTVIANDKKYGPIGVIFALMSWLIAIGVVIILGAVAGIVWRERGLTFRAGFRKLFRRSSPEGPAAAAGTAPGDAAIGTGGGVEQAQQPEP